MREFLHWLVGIGCPVLLLFVVFGIWGHDWLDWARERGSRMAARLRVLRARLAARFKPVKEESNG